MISFTLRCDQGHRFDGWFKDNATFDAQVAAGQVACPHCGATVVEKAPMAPSIGKARGDAGENKMADMMRQMRDHLLAVRKHVEANADYVGDRFAAEALSIHLGEAEQRDIYGEASDDDVAELREEGVEFVRIPWVNEGN